MSTPRPPHTRATEDGSVPTGEEARPKDFSGVLYPPLNKRHHLQST